MCLNRSGNAKKHVLSTEMSLLKTINLEKSENAPSLLEFPRAFLPSPWVFPKPFPNIVLFNQQLLPRELGGNCRNKKKGGETSCGKTSNFPFLSTFLLRLRYSKLPAKRAKFTFRVRLQLNLIFFGDFPCFTLPWFMGYFSEDLLFRCSEPTLEKVASGW